MRLLGGVLHGAEGPPGLGGHIEGARGVPAARRKEGVGVVVVSGFPNRIGIRIGRRRGDGYGALREAEHERGAVLLGDEAAELALGLVDRLEVVLAHRGVGLHHGC